MTGMPSADALPMSVEIRHIAIDVRLDGDQISGRAGDGTDQPQAFAGWIGLLQVLDASRALSDARLMYARALVAANESLFDLGVLAGYDARTAARLGRGPAETGGARPDGGAQ